MIEFLPFLATSQANPVFYSPTPALKVFRLEKPLQCYREVALQVAILIPTLWN